MIKVKWVIKNSYNYRGKIIGEKSTTTYVGSIIGTIFKPFNETTYVIVACEDGKIREVDINLITILK